MGIALITLSPEISLLVISIWAPLTIEELYSRNASEMPAMGASVRGQGTFETVNASGSGRHLLLDLTICNNCSLLKDLDPDHAHRKLLGDISRTRR